MELSVNDAVKVSGKVLKKNNQVVELDEEPAVLLKIDGVFVYVKTQYGTHYVSISQITK